MRKLITAAESKAMDRYAMEQAGIPSLVLMERASLAAASALRERWDASHRTAILCGSGNNGADGLAMARILFLWGYKVDVYFSGEEERTTSEWKKQRE